MYHAMFNLTDETWEVWTEDDECLAAGLTQWEADAYIEKLNKEQDE